MINSKRKYSKMRNEVQTGEGYRRKRGGEGFGVKGRQGGRRKR